MTDEPNTNSVYDSLTAKPYVILGPSPVECCGNAEWRGGTCQYHSGWEDGIAAVLDHLGHPRAEQTDRSVCLRVTTIPSTGRTTFDAIHHPEGYVNPELERLVAEAIRRYPNQDALSWLSPVAAILVVEEWLLRRAQIDGPGDAT